MAAIRIYRRLQDLQDVDPNGLPQSGVPRYHTDVSSFVVETIAGGAGGSFSLGASTGGNTLGDTGVTGTRVVLAGVGNLTLSQATDANGGTISISGGTAGAGGVAISASNSLFSSGTVVLTGAGGGATVNTAPGTIQISVAAPVAQTVQTQNRFNLTLGGNTAGALQEVSSGTLTLAGGNGITLSQAGNAITISGSTFSQSVQPETQTFLGGVAASNTTYTSGTVSIVGSGDITVQSGTGQRIIISGSQSVQPETQTFVGGIIASNTTYTSGSIRFTGVGGGVTVSSNTGQRVDISVAAQTGTQFSAGLTNSGNTSGDTGTVGGRLLLVGTNNITMSGSTNGASMTITVSGPSVAGAQTGISGVANTETTYTSGTVKFLELGAITIRSTTGQQFQFSVNSQTNQTEGWYALGNTTGQSSSTTFDARTISVRGDGIISVGYSGGTLRISASQSAQAETQTFVGGLANSQTTYTSGTVGLSELGAITIRSTTGNQFQLSVNSQTVQTQGVPSMGVSTGGNTSGDTTVNSGTRLVFVGSNNITLSQGTAANATTITISGGAGGAFSGGVSSIGNTAGNTGITGSQLVLSGGQSITLSQSTNASGATVGISGASTSQSVQTQGILNVALSNIGNTSGDTGIGSGTRYVLAGGNNITLSGSTAANATTVTISAPNQSVQTQDVLSVGASTGGNTAGNTTVNTGSRLVFAGSNLITVSQGTAAGATTLTLDASNQNLSVGASTGGNTAGNTTVNTGSRLVFVGSNNITISQGTAAGATTLTLSGPTQTGTQFSAGLSNIGNTSGDTVTVNGRLILAGGNNVTLSGSSNGVSETITISAFNQTVESQSIGMSNLGNTAGTTGIASGGQVRFIIVGSNNITASQSLNGASGTLSLSGNPAFSEGVSTGGNTGGATGITGTRMVWVGSNNITLSQTTDASGGTVSIFGPSPGAAQYSIGVSTGGNTAGSTGVTGTRIVFVGTNNLSLSQSTDANGATISFNNTVSAGSIGVSTDGNTAGATGVTGTRYVLVGSSPISLSQTTGANGGTVTINAPATSSLSGASGISISTNGSTISVFPAPRTSYNPFDEAMAVTGQQGNATLHIQPFHPPHLQYDRILLSYQFSNATNSSNSFTISNWVGIYTKNASTLSLVSSISTSTNFSGSGTAGSYTLYGGMRHLSVPWTMTLTDGDYWMGIVTRTTSGGGAGHTLNQMLKSVFTAATLTGWSGLMGAATNATVQQQVGLGTYSVSTAGIPNTVGFSEITGTGSLPLMVPLFQFRSGTV